MPGLHAAIRSSVSARGLRSLGNYVDQPKRKIVFSANELWMGSQDPLKAFLEETWHWLSENV